jgi:transcriptional regulator with XRE-family HTH domain
MATSGRRKQLGAAMLKARKAKGWTQREVEQRMRELGDNMSSQLLSGYERGEYAPDIDRVRLLERVLGVELVAHLGLPSEPPALDPSEFVAWVEEMKELRARVEALESERRGSGSGAGAR